MPRMIKSSSAITPWRWAWAGALVGLVLTTLLNAPARWLTDPLQQSLNGRVLLQEVRGTIWRGSAQLALTGGAGSSAAAALPGRVAWTLRPTWQGLHAALQADCCTEQALRVTVLPRWGGAQLLLADGLSQWPAQVLTGLGTPWNTVQAEGQLIVSTQGLSALWVEGRVVLAGRLQLEASQIASRLSTLKPMGSYRITVQGGATPVLQLETLAGSLQLSGRGQWVGGQLRFEGEARAAPDRLDALSNLLNIIGRRDGARAIIKVG